MFSLTRQRPPGQPTRTLRVPLLPLRDVVVFPHMVAPLFVGREKSIRALESAMGLDKNIFLSAQKDAKVDNPGQKDIFRLGTLSTVLQLLRLPDGTVKTLIEGKRRARILSYLPHGEHFLVEVEVLDDLTIEDAEAEALIRSATQAFDRYAKLNKKVPEEITGSVNQIEDPSRLADTIIAHLNLKIDVKQNLLEIVDSNRRLERLLEVLGAEIEISQLEQRIKKRVKQQMEKTQKEYYLNEQMRAIQHEMGDKDDFKNEIKELEEQLSKKRMPRAAADKCAHEIKKLKFMSPMSAEATVVRNYIDWLLSLPWYERTRDKLDLAEAERILDEDHYGLEKPKERILEYLAVQSLVRRIRGPILCLVGPPGVGKTSLAKSVARAMGRKFVRLSLGGVRDEAEIRGHRRTYIGALPGKIIQSLRKARSNNPVFCLDEVDKMSADFRGDPSAALLEVLDPEQNFAFNDHYLDIDYDLSEILFITTANTLYAIPPPLQDRMEIIRLPGYTEYDKLNIATQFLTRKQCRANGLDPKRVNFTDNAIKTIIRSYTREAGVRNLEREIASICRKVAREVVKEDRRDEKSTISKNSIGRYLGVPRFRRGQLEEADSIGLTNGLAWTEVGGEVLMTEVVIMPGRGRLTITGKLGDVMQESAQAALSYVRSRAMSLGLSRHFYQKIDTHIHVPEGAIPKDGPSAGITIATSIVSALLQLPVRRDLAMTGEITLRGRVLPIGGLKEKLLAANRLGIKKVLIPLENEKDLKEIPPKVLKVMEIIPVEHMDQVLRQAIAIEDPESVFHDEKDDFLSRIMAVKKERPAPQGSEEVTAH
jgi:ATP-dependent Lon protease